MSKSRPITSELQKRDGRRRQERESRIGKGRGVEGFAIYSLSLRVNGPRRWREEAWGRESGRVGPAGMKRAVGAWNVKASADAATPPRSRVGSLLSWNLKILSFLFYYSYFKPLFSSILITSLSDLRYFPLKIISLNLLQVHLRPLFEQTKNNLAKQDGRRAGFYADVLIE